jgi:hypothetical protein
MRFEVGSMTRHIQYVAYLSFFLASSVVAGWRLEGTASCGWWLAHRSQSLVYPSVACFPLTRIVIITANMSSVQRYRSQ